jgi:hypothetical protein
MVDPAVVTAIRAPFAAARTAALLHLERNGLDVPELAAEVARRLGDDDEDVREQALRTFQAVGAGAAAAVPVLSDAVGSGDPDLRGRALRCLAVAGPVAHRAVPRVVELLENPEHATDALAALVAIAPEHPALPRAIGEALFAPSFDAWSRAADALARADADVVDRVVERVVEAVRAGSAAEHVRGVRLLATLAALRPDAVLEVAYELLEEDDPELVRPALAALERMGPAALPALPGVLARLRRDPEARDAALEAIAAMGPEATRAVPVLCELVAQPGDVGLVAASARTLRALAPDGLSTVPILTRVLREGLGRLAPTDCWALGEIAETVGAIGHGVPDAALALDEALGVAIGAVAARVGDGESSLELAHAVVRGITALGREARRSLPTLLTLLEDPELGPAAAAAIPAVDASERCREEVEAAGHVWAGPRRDEIVHDAEVVRVHPDPDPDPDPPPPVDDGEVSVRWHVVGVSPAESDDADSPLAHDTWPGQDDRGQSDSGGLRARALPMELAHEMSPARAAARRFAGVTDSAPAEEVVRSIEWALERAPANRSEDEIADLAYELGVLWGDQVVRAAGWQWAEVVWDDGSAPAIVSPNRTHACFPSRFLADAIEGTRTGLVTRVFARIRAGDLPVARAGALAIVG